MRNNATFLDIFQPSAVGRSKIMFVVQTFVRGNVHNDGYAPTALGQHDGFSVFFQLFQHFGRLFAKVRNGADMIPNIQVHRKASWKYRCLYISKYNQYIRQKCLVQGILPKKLSFIFNLLILCHPLTAAAAQKTILILPFHNSTGNAAYDPLAKNMPDLLAAAIQDHSKDVRVVERKELEKVMAENALEWERMKEQGRPLTRLGRMLQANYIMKGSIIPDGKKLRVIAFLYETETMKRVQSADAVGTLKEMNVMMETMAQTFASPPKTLSGLRTGDVPDARPVQSQQMIRGLGFFHQHRYPQAAAEFMKILEETPKDVDAKYWLAKSLWFAGLSDQAKIECAEFTQWFPKDPRTKETTPCIFRNP